MKYFVAGIDTNVGKTLVSAVLVEALGADYWKPIQTGCLQDNDSQHIRSLVSPLAQRQFFPEAYAFQEPASPHYAAALENQRIDINKIIIPDTQKPLVIEGAGGLLVPLNEQFLLIDWIEKMKLPVVLVVRNYLGSINHSLLSIEALQRRSISILGIVFNGQASPASEDYILNYTQTKCLARINWEAAITREIVMDYATVIKEKLKP